MTSLRSIFQTPKLISLSSQNGELILARKNPLTLVSFSLIFYNPVMNLTLSFYDINGNLASSITVNQSVNLIVKNSDFSKITWNDINNYTVSGWVQEILPQNQEQLDELLADFQYQLVPVGNVIITSPLDNYGNIKASIQTPIPFNSPLNVSTFTQTLTTANTKQALNSAIAYNFVSIINLSPSDTIFIGDINNQIIPLTPNSVYSIDIHEAPLKLNSIYWIGATATTDMIGVFYA